MTGGSRFTLYPQERQWWSFNDYQAVIDVVAKLGARRVLEFGPGSSTLALIEAGATYIDTCEDDPEWEKRYQIDLVDRFPDIVHMRMYTWSDPLSVQVFIDSTAYYDLALIDGPRDTKRRPAVLRYALDRAQYVLLPLEESPVGHVWLRPIVQQIAEEKGRSIGIFETGPLAGAFALLGPKASHQ